MSGKIKGAVLVNAYQRLEEAMYQPRRMSEELTALGVETDILRNDFFPVSTGGKEGLHCGLKEYDFVVYLDKDKYILQGLGEAGVPVFNPPRAIEICDDKMTTHLALSRAGIPMPRTFPGLLCYDAEEKIKNSTLDIVEMAFGFPVVVKESYGSLGKEVFLVHNREQLRLALGKVKCRPHLIQEFVPTSAGRDLRVIVVGDKVLGGMLRIGGGNDFRSNIGAGGRGEPFDVPEKVAEYALRAAKTIGLDYCGIDFLFGKDDEMLLCEVNSNAFFRTFESVTGINVARAYAEHILAKIAKKDSDSH